MSLLQVFSAFMNLTEGVICHFSVERFFVFVFVFYMPHLLPFHTQLENKVVTMKEIVALLNLVREWYHVVSNMVLS